MAYFQGETKGLRNYLFHCPFLRSITGDQTQVWGEDDLRPYLLYLHQERVVDAFFGGIVFEAERSSDGSELSAKSLGFGSTPTVGAWREACSELFQRGQNLAAALELSKEIPFGKTIDIWIALPYAVVGQQPFGTIGDQILHFRQDPKHREVALKWWIDLVITEWQALSDEVGGHRARFCGFVWSKSSLAPHDEQLVIDINSYLHELGYQILWMQNYGTLKGHEGKRLGFDVVFTRPTYLGSKRRGIEWVEHAASYARAFEHGLILWAGGIDNPNQMIELLNLGCNRFVDAFQLFELPAKAARQMYEEGDPMYVYLYAYTKKAYRPIPLPADKGEEGR